MAFQAATTRPGASLPDLVQRARDGDRAAFEFLYRDFARTVHGILLAHAGPRDVDDLTQEVFLSAFQRLPELRDSAAFPAWLCTAARHAAVDSRRARGRRPQAEDLAVAQGVAAPARAPAEDAAGRELAERILREVGALPDAYRETLVLRLVEGLSGPEIALRTGLTHGSVRVNLSRGMAMLRPRLQKAGLT